MTVQISEEMLEHVAQPGNVPSVSVVVPSYRGGRFLREALASVQSQTLEDWEIIIVCIGVVVAFGQALLSSPRGSLRVARRAVQRHTEWPFHRRLHTFTNQGAPRGSPGRVEALQLTKT
jgi:hypothetical protein